MKYAVLGSAGQLGRDLCPQLGGEVVALTRHDADLTQADSLRTALTALRPDVVVNCAAYNFVDRAESERELAMAVNAWGVRALAEICRDLSCTLLHFSSDYVFGLDESRRMPYLPNDAPGPLSIYGLSKLVGEYFVRAIVPKHFVIRTCGLYGVHGAGGKGGNFIETMLKLAREGKPLRVVADQHCTPSYTADIAQSATSLLRSERYGIHHQTNAGSCSWFELANEAIKLTGMNTEVTPITSAEWKSAARRPTYSVLGCEIALRPWPEALAAYLKERCNGDSPT